MSLQTNGHAQAFEPIPLSDFDKELGNTSTEVSSIALGGRIVSCSDEWFAPASDLLKVHPAQSMKGQFGPAGALFDGWETRRHNPEPYDWVIIRLGPKSGAHIAGFDVDTANFNGNEAPEVEIFGLSLNAEEEDNSVAVTENDSRVRLSELYCYIDTDVHHLHSGNRSFPWYPADPLKDICSS